MKLELLSRTKYLLEFYINKILNLLILYLIIGLSNVGQKKLWENQTLFLLILKKL